MNGIFGAGEYKVSIIEPLPKVFKVYSKEQVKVCAYCRVSTDAADQKNSLQAQSEFFINIFSKHPDWINKGIYADEGISGTSLEKRTNFNRMISMAKRKEVDVIFTKEVSRFSRNVRDLLDIVEDLRTIGVYIYFLTDDINTESDHYRESLTQIAANAEQESLRTSRRVKWGQRQMMIRGKVFGRHRMYGYNIKKDERGEQQFEVIEEEAIHIRKIFLLFAQGNDIRAIKKLITDATQKEWSSGDILRILRNEKYVGDLEQGKTYTPDPLTHKKKYNEGGSARYYIKDHHPQSAIVSREMWEAVTQKLEKQKNIATRPSYSAIHWVSGKIYCGICGRRYIFYSKKQKNSLYEAWVCSGNHLQGNKAGGCSGKRVNDRVLKMLVTDFFGSSLHEKTFSHILEKITVYPENMLKVETSEPPCEVIVKYSVKGRGENYIAEFKECKDQ